MPYRPALSNKRERALSPKKSSKIIPLIHPIHPSINIYLSVFIIMTNDSTPECILQKRPVLHFERKYGALVCLECNNGFPRKAIIKHFRVKHKFKCDTYRPILKAFAREPLAKDWKDLRRPADGSAPIEGLRMRVGYVCTACHHRTTSEEIADDHLKCGGQVLHVLLQCWNSSGDGAYWVVIPPLRPQEPAAAAAAAAADGAPASQTGHILDLCYIYIHIFTNNDVGLSLQQIAIEKVLERECQLNEEEESRRIEPNGKDDVSLWEQWMQ
jgi:Orsellinic acid/F9775 biosynthesis cluster protein D